jgi:hypothetical protein
MRVAEMRDQTEASIVDGTKKHGGVTEGNPTART